MTFKWVLLSIFKWTQSNLNLEISGKLNFNDCSLQTLFELFQIWTKYAKLEPISPLFPYLEHLQEINSSFVTITKLSSNAIKETFCERLK